MTFARGLSPEDCHQKVFEADKEGKASSCNEKRCSAGSTHKESDEKDDVGLLMTFTSLYSTKLVHKHMTKRNLNEVARYTIPIFLNMKSNSFAKAIERHFKHKESFI